MAGPHGNFFLHYAMYGAVSARIWCPLFRAPHFQLQIYFFLSWGKKSRPSWQWVPYHSRWTRAGAGASQGHRDGESGPPSHGNSVSWGLYGMCSFLQDPLVEGMDADVQVRVRFISGGNAALACRHPLISLGPGGALILRESLAGYRLESGQVADRPEHWLWPSCVWGARWVVL